MLRYAPAAGERAAERGSPREAQHHYWRALRFAEGIDPAARAELLERFCEHAYLSDMRSEAVGAIDEAIAIHRRRGDVAREGHALRLRARLLGCIGRAREAADTIREAVRVLEQGPPGAELARAYSYLAGMAMLDYDFAQTISLGAKAIAIAEEVDDVEGLVHALNNVGTAELIAGYPTGAAKLERSLELARQAHLGTDAGRAYINLSCGLIHHWRWREALVWIERGIGYTRELGLEAWVKCLVGERGARRAGAGPLGRRGGNGASAPRRSARPDHRTAHVRAACRRARARAARRPGLLAAVGRGVGTRVERRRPPVPRPCVRRPRRGGVAGGATGGDRRRDGDDLRPRLPAERACDRGLARLLAGAGGPSGRAAGQRPRAISPSARRRARSRRRAASGRGRRLRRRDCARSEQRWLIAARRPRAASSAWGEPRGGDPRAAAARARRAQPSAGAARQRPARIPPD